MKANPFQVVEAKSMAGLVRDNHFAALYEEKPQYASLVMNKMLSRTFGSTLETYLADKPAEYFETDRDYFWKLQGNHERNIPLLYATWAGAPVTENTTNVGANRSEFSLVFPERWFDEGHVIVGNRNELYPIYIVSMQQINGSEWEYTCISQRPDADGIPGEELVAGAQFSIEFSPVESTMSVRGTGIRRTTPIEFRNGFTTTRKENTIPGNMKSRKMVAGWVNPETGKPFATWIEAEDFTLHYEFMEEKLRHMYFGRTNRDSEGRSYMQGPSTNEILIGAGLREMMEVSNSMYYTEFSLQLIEDAMLTLAEGKLGNDERVFMLRTGERGAVQFSKAVKAEASGWLPIRDDNAIYSVSSPLHKNARGFGFQFTEYLAPNNVRLIVEVDSNYSNQVRNKIEHPDGGKAESYRYDIFDIGTVQGAPNIQKAFVTGSEYIVGYEVGLRSPWSADNRNAVNIMSNSRDAWTCTVFAQHGIILRDPERTMSIIPSVLVA